MTNKNTTTKAKDSEEVKKKETDQSKDQNVESKDGVVGNISYQEGNDTKGEEEALKSKENDSIEKNDFSWADEKMSVGKTVALPEWEGFWFKEIASGKTFVLTKEGKVLDNPDEKYKEETGWEEIEPTEDQQKALEKFWEGKRSKKEKSFTGLKAKAYNKGRGTGFIKLKKHISIKDLQDRKNLPNDVSRTSEFVMTNDLVYDLENQQLTNKKISKI